MRPSKRVNRVQIIVFFSSDTVARESTTNSRSLTTGGYNKSCKRCLIRFCLSYGREAYTIIRIIKTHTPYRTRWYGGRNRNLGKAGSCMRKTT